jgi:hypothetical protein
MKICVIQVLEMVAMVGLILQKLSWWWWVSEEGERKISSVESL